jgi:hypothetical protein
MSENPYVLEMRRMISSARLEFLKLSLPHAREDRDYKLARSISQAIGEISVEQGMAAFFQQLAEWRADPPVVARPEPE